MKYESNNSNEHEKSREYVITKDNIASSLTKLKGMVFGDLVDKEFKTVVLRKLNELQENIEKQVNKIRKIYLNKLKNVAKK